MLSSLGTSQLTSPRFMLHLRPCRWKFLSHGGGSINRSPIDLCGVTYRVSVNRSKSSRSKHDPRAEAQRLLALLFPEQQALPRKPATQHREQQRLKESSNTTPPKPKSRVNDVEEDERPEKRVVASKAVLLFTAASKYLGKDDFTRVVPQGKRMEGWQLRNGQIDIIIPGRNLYTLEREEHYFLVFESIKSAQTYQKRAMKLARLLSFHGPPSRISEAPIPSGLHIPGENSHELMRRYTLTSPSQYLDLRLLPSPLTPGVEDLVKHGGYPMIKNRTAKSPFEVVIRMDFAKVSVAGLHHVLSAAERDRNLPWSKLGYRKFRIYPWIPPSPASIPDLLGEIAQRANEALSVDFGADYGGYAGMHNDTSDFVDLVNPNTIPLVQRNDGDDDTYDVDEQASNKTVARTFIVGLQSAHEAETFARHWHRKVLQKSSEPNIVLNAEVLW